MKNKLLLFFSAFMQVGLVACNVVFISTGNIIAAVIAAFSVSMMRSFDMKKIVNGSFWDRLTCAFGAASGTLVGYLISNLFK